MHERDIHPMTGGTTSAEKSSTATQTAEQVSESAKRTANQVTGTAREQGRQVAGQIGNQVSGVASDFRDSVVGQVRTGNRKAADGLRRIADDLGGMAGEPGGSPANQMVRRLSDSGHRAANYLEERGPEGLLDDVQEFARRKPGTFLLAAAAAGFVIGRLARTTVAAARSGEDAGTTDAGGYSGYDTSAAYDTAPPAPTAAGFDDPYATPSVATYDPRAAGATAVGTASVDTPAGADYDSAGFPVDPVAVPERGGSR